MIKLCTKGDQIRTSHKIPEPIQQTQTIVQTSPFLPPVMAPATYSTNINHVTEKIAPFNMYVGIAEDHTHKPSVPEPTKQLQTNHHQNHNPLPSPVRSQVLAIELQGYDANLYSSLIDGFKFGFKLGLEGDLSPRISKNHKSATENRDKVYEKLAKESLKGRIAGPFHSPPLENLVCSPLGLVPKNVPGKFRLIHDLSFPKNTGPTTP